MDRSAMQSTEEASDRLLLRPEEAARLLGVGRTQLYALLREGRLESVTIGRLRRVPVSACHAFVESLRTEPAR